jgi:hypothetical protein
MFVMPNVVDGFLVDGIFEPNLYTFLDLSRSSFEKNPTTYRPSEESNMRPCDSSAALYNQLSYTESRCCIYGVIYQ